MQGSQTAPVLPGGPYFAVGGAVFGNLQPEDVAHVVKMMVTQAPQSFASEVVLRPTQKP